MMAEATDNEDGSINYQELIPVFSEIINTQQASSKHNLDSADCECPSIVENLLWQILIYCVQHLTQCARKC